MSDYIESIFQGVEILIDKKLEDLAYDKTVVCTITDTSDSKNGSYRVTDGKLSYLAYSDKSTYREGEQVRVNVPQGDFSKRKFIIGKYLSDENNSALTYVSPLESIVNVSGNLTSILGNREFGILANGSETSRILWTQKMDMDQYKDLSTTGIYNTLIIKADFKTDLYNYNYVTGEYGLRIELLVRPSPGSTTQFNKMIELSSKEMFGNPYNFTLFSPQAKVVDVSTEGVVEAIQLSIYQKDNFYNDKGEKILPLEGMSSNIFIKNIELGFGSNALDVEDNVVKIYSPDNRGYDGYSDTDSTNRKRIGLIWYNKDENNKFIGFNDSEYDPDYSELDYLSISNADFRLINQKGKENVPYDKIGLTLAANMEETIPKLYNVMSLLTQDLCSEINYLLNQYDKQETTLTLLMTKVKEQVTAAVLGGVNDFKQEFIGAKEYVDNLRAEYEKVLLYAYQMQNQVEKPIENPLNSLVNYYNCIFTRLKGSLNESITNTFSAIEITNFLKWITQTIETIDLNSGEKELYNNFIIKINRIINKIYDIVYNLSVVYIDDNKYYIDEFADEKIDNGINISVNNYITQLTRNYDYYKPYAEADLSQYDNKYAIYWYRYDQNYEAPADEYTFMPPGWRMIQSTDEDNPLMNYSTIEQMLQGDCYIEPYMNPKKETEKFVAVVCYNHEVYKSNELVFSNNHHVRDEDAVDAADALRFEHMEHSMNSYLVYNEIFYLFDSADEHYQREIRCRYDGLLAKDEALINSHIYWYVPIESTMITYDRQFLIDERGFDCDHDSDGLLIENLPYSRNNYVCFYKMIEGTQEGLNLDFSGNGYDDRSFWYKIKPQLEKDAMNNKIVCKVIMEENPAGVEQIEYFNFGSRGSNGTAYTFAIESINGNKAIVSGLETLKLNVSLKDGNNTLIPFSEIMNKNGNKPPVVNWYCYDGDQPDLDFSKYKSNLLVINNNSKKQSYGILQAILPFKIQDEGTDSERKIELSCLYSVPWCLDNKLYLSGHTYIAYNNFGTIDNISAYNKPYQLLEKNTDIIKTGLRWEIKGYTINSSTNQLDALEDEQRQQYDAYIPKLDVENRLIPPPLYVADTGVISVLIATGIEDKIEYFRSPIILTQQKYPSKFLNNWDGNFMLDEKNGIIMSSMLGAGRKNEDNTFNGVLMGEIELNADVPIMKNNLGEGRHSGLGLYGFHEGQQAFGFNIDGSAFIGKAGGGRIMFDGNNGFIASANWFTGTDNSDHPEHGENNPYPNGGQIGNNGTILKSSNAGMCIDLQDGHIDAYNFKLSSNNIYLNSNPTGVDPNDDRDQYYLQIGNDKNAGLISFDKDGKLQIYVRELFLKSSIGGPNLLRQTNPKQSRDNGWELDQWIVSKILVDGGVTIPSGSLQGANGKDNIGNSLYLTVASDSDFCNIVQNNLQLDKKYCYMLSGYIYTGNAPSFTTIVFSKDGEVSFDIDYAKWNNTILDVQSSSSVIYRRGTTECCLNDEHNLNQWNYFEILFNFEKASQNPVRISIKTETDTKLWHLQLEEGTCASAWKENINDVNSSMTQQEIFDKLFKDPATNTYIQGVSLTDGKVYISAEVIQTGILKSDNYNGTVEEITGEISDHPEEGTYINLNTGTISTPYFYIEQKKVFATDEDFAANNDNYDLVPSGKIGGWQLHPNKFYYEEENDVVNSDWTVATKDNNDSQQQQWQLDTLSNWGEEIFTQVLSLPTDEWVLGSVWYGEGTDYQISEYNSSNVRWELVPFRKTTYNNSIQFAALVREKWKKGSLYKITAESFPAHVHLGDEEHLAPAGDYYITGFNYTTCCLGVNSNDTVVMAYSYGSTFNDREVNFDSWFENVGVETVYIYSNATDKLIIKEKLPSQAAERHAYELNPRGDNIMSFKYKLPGVSNFAEFFSISNYGAIKIGPEGDFRTYLDNKELIFQHERGWESGILLHEGDGYKEVNWHNFAQKGRYKFDFASTSIDLYGGGGPHSSMIVTNPNGFPVFGAIAHSRKYDTIYWDKHEKGHNIIGFDSTVKLGCGVASHWYKSSSPTPGSSGWYCWQIPTGCIEVWGKETDSELGTETAKWVRMDVYGEYGFDPFTTQTEWDNHKVWDPEIGTIKISNEWDSGPKLIFHSYTLEITGNVTTPSSVAATSFTNMSKEEFKSDIKKLNRVLDLFNPNKSTIYSYKMKKNIKPFQQKQNKTFLTTEVEEVEDIDSYGFVIGENYLIPKEVMNKEETGVNLYSMASLNWKATQELYELYQDLSSKIDDLQHITGEKGEINNEINK